MKAKDRQFVWLGLIIWAYLLLAVVYSITVPLAETPDESEHFLYLQHIALNRELPVMQPVREDNVTLEAHQPPLLYLTGAALTGWLDLDPADNLVNNSCFSFEETDKGRQHAFFHRLEEWPPQRGVFQAFQFMRWFSILLGFGTVIFTWFIGRVILPDDDRVGLIAAAMIAFNPQWIHITASLNNDVPTTFLGAVIIYFSILAAQKPRRRFFLVLGFLLGLGFLTKFALLAFWPLTLLAAFVPFFHPSFRDSLIAIRNNLHRLVPNLLLLTLLPIFIAGWWYWRNLRLFGDPLLWEVTLAAKGSVIARTTPFTLADLGEFITLHFQSYWLWFGWLNVKGPTWIYWLLFAIVLVTVSGLVWLFVKRHLNVNWWAILICFLGIIAVYASLLQYIQTINWTGYQGRLAYVAAAPIAALLGVGLYSWNKKWLGSLVTGGLLTLSVLAVPLILLPAYPRPQIYQPSPDLPSTCLRFASGLQVEAVAVDEEVEPGQNLTVTVYGYGLKSAEKPQEFEVFLSGWAGEAAGRGRGWLDWDAGQVVSATVSFPIGDARPSRGQLRFGLITPDGSWQPATSATGRVLEVPVEIETVKISPADPFQADPEHPLNVNFGDKIALIGYDLTPSSGLVTLYWQALQPMASDYTTFVHLLDGNGRLVNQNDSEPNDGRYPTSIWEKGEIVADPKQLNLAPAGDDYQLAVGVYLLETLVRLPLYSDTGERLPEDQFILPHFPP